MPPTAALGDGPDHLCCSAPAPFPSLQRVPSGEIDASFGQEFGCGVGCHGSRGSPWPDQGSAKAAGHQESAPLVALEPAHNRTPPPAQGLPLAQGSHAPTMSSTSASSTIPVPPERELASLILRCSGRPLGSRLTSISRASPVSRQSLHISGFVVAMKFARHQTLVEFVAERYATRSADVRVSRPESIH